MVVICGATGKIGGTVARVLRSRGLPVKAIVRDASKAGALLEQGCDIAVAKSSGRESHQPRIQRRGRGVRHLPVATLGSELGRAQHGPRSVSDHDLAGPRASRQRVRSAAIGARSPLPSNAFEKSSSRSGIDSIARDCTQLRRAMPRDRPRWRSCFPISSRVTWSRCAIASRLGPKEHISSRPVPKRRPGERTWFLADAHAAAMLRVPGS